MHLLQLVGGQIWPNLLPILGFKPNKVTFLTSSDPNELFRQSIEHLSQAAKEMGISFEYSILSTSGRQPTLLDCIRTLNDNSSSYDLINLTGGSKPMSIAAYQYATDHKIPSFYLDTRRSKSSPFENTHTADLTLDFPNITEIAKNISVRSALAAQGFPVPPHFKKPSTRELDFAKKAAELRNSPEDNRTIAKALNGIRKTLHDDKGNFLRKGKLRSALKQSIHCEKNTPFHAYLQNAVHAQLLDCPDSEEEFYLTCLDPATENADILKKEVENNFKLMEGIWFELAVYAHLSEKSSFADIAWSVEGDSDARGETDLVAFNLSTFNLHFISCKTTGPHSSPLDHIQGLRRRATKEGGRFSKAELWIFSPKSEQNKKTLSRLCEENEVALRIFTEVATGVPPVER